ncbi:lipoyl-dependent peroxiredoxin, partial [Phenoliferia sp. Uapishka_3]
MAPILVCPAANFRPRLNHQPPAISTEMSFLRTSLLRTVRTPSPSVRTLTTLDPLLYTASATSTGSRASGASSSEEGNIAADMGLPKEMGGAKGPRGGHSNPEQLFGMAYSTCFLSALGAVHGIQSPTLKALPKSTSVRALVSIGKSPKGVPEGFLLGVELEIVRGPLMKVGLNEEAMVKLVKAAHEMCPYSRATKGNIEVEVRLVDH